MIPRDPSALWSALGPALADHVWQSTLFAAAAALVALCFRKNQARIRYWIWIAASLKFLVPFAPLVALGKQLAGFRPASAQPAGRYFTIEEIGRPFTSAVAGRITLAASPVHVPAAGLLFPQVLILVWFIGFVVLLGVWCARWRRISAAIRESVPLRDGREFKALRRLESAAGSTGSLRILSSPTTLEPGIFGIFRPVLLWPQGISEHLTPDHLEAVLAHEFCHVRRRDNLAAALHMLVEALFWFHPLVWWMGARLIEERERACDEQVLEFGSQREVYAESILKVCEFCIGSPLACVAGVTGSDLKQRMVHIMSEQIAQKLGFTKKLLLTAAAFLALVLPIAFGFLNPAPARAQSTDDGAGTAAFQSFSIRPSQGAGLMPTYTGRNMHTTKMMLGPDGFFADHVTMATLIEEAYGVEASQLSGGPDWLNTDRFDVQGRVDNSAPDNLAPGPEKFRTAVQPMLRAGLSESAKLAVHTETRQIPTYALVVADGGSKLQPAPPDGAAAGPGVVGMRRMMMVQKGSAGQVVGLDAQGISVSDFASQLSRQLGTVVIDKTNLQGNYNFDLQWAAEQAEKRAAEQAENRGAEQVDQQAAEQAEKQAAERNQQQSDDGLLGSGNNGAAPAISAALEQQLGLKLIPQIQLMPVVVIDHIEKPAGN